MLQLYKRHTKDCAERRRQEGAKETVAQWGAYRGYRRCTCPIHAEGTLRLAGFVRRTTGETKWPRAEEWKKKAEDAGTLSVGPPTPPTPQESPTVDHVVRQFTNDRTACGLSPSTLKKYRQFTDLLGRFCVEKGVVYITQFGVDHARVFRE